MTNRHRSIEPLIDAAERIAVVGSPSSTGGMAIDILGNAVNKKLVGELALFRYLQDGHQHYALGQITEVQLRNVWHEDPTMRSLIRQRGRVDAVSERQDTHQGTGHWHTGAFGRGCVTRRIIISVSGSNLLSG